MYGLFEVFGVELEYMIVDRQTLRVRPIADELIREMTGEYTSDVERGDIAWSNELVSHVIELKTHGPAKSLEGLSKRFTEEVVYINQRLERYNAMLLPTGAHPLFHPETETVIWPHEHNEVYALYDRIFGCKGHGWSNLQSTHLNLPFANDEEFASLHAAIRVLLPLIPALCASTPIIEGKVTGLMDTRLEYYRKNQQKIPSIAGLVIPEAVFSKEAYEQEIFSPISKAIAPYDSEGVLSKYFLNSRGAIARFDRGAIEIRVIDIQECPRADIALLELIVTALKWLIKTRNLQELQYSCSTQDLAEILVNSVRYGSLCVTNKENYLGLFGLKTASDMRTIWQSIFAQCENQLSEEAWEVSRTVIANGNLSERILQRISEDPSESGILAIYGELASCLAENRLFKP